MIEVVEEDSQEVVKRKMLNEIHERTKGTSIEFEEKEVEDPINKGNINKRRFLIFPAGRETKRISLNIFDRINLYHEIPFEKYVFLNRYFAVCSYELGVIEARIGSNNEYSSEIIYKLLFGGYLPRDGNIEEQNYILTIGENENSYGVKIIIGFPSKEGRVLLARARTARLPTIRIEGLSITTQDQATEILEKISNSIFFEIDLKTGLPIFLIKEQNRDIEKPNFGKLDLKFPITEFDKDPLYLYWYARSASNLPLLEYLAHYQTIEYYFPHYQEHNARKAVSNIMKSPVFNVHDDSHIIKVISTIRTFSDKGNYDEKSQLLSTLKEVVDIHELKNYIMSRDYLKEYFMKKDHKKISAIKVNVESENSIFIEEISKRIYDIRCKIVHTKASYDNGNFELILPFSKEAEKLKNDIDILRFISKQVIIAGGKKFTF